MDESYSSNDDGYLNILVGVRLFPAVFQQVLECVLEACSSSNKFLFAIMIIFILFLLLLLLLLGVLLLTFFITSSYNNDNDNYFDY